MVILSKSVKSKKSSKLDKSDKSKKSDKPVKNKTENKKESEVPIESTSNAKDLSDEEDDEDYLDDSFFNQDSYNSYIQKNSLTVIDPVNYVNNDIHKVDAITPDEYRITSDIMTLAEYTRVISERAKQIENGSIIFVDVKDETDTIKIAEMEVFQKKSPLKIRRDINKSIYELWRVNEMVLPFQ